MIGAESSIGVLKADDVLLCVEQMAAFRMVCHQETIPNKFVMS